MPRPGSSVIHPGMLTALGAVAETAHTSTCRVLRNQDPTGRGPFDPATGTYGPTATTPIWAGHCRVQPRVRADIPLVDAAGDPTAIAQYQVTVSRAAPAVLVDDVVEIINSPDPLMVGRVLRVVDQLVGDLELERHLVCQDDSGRARREG